MHCNAPPIGVRCICTTGSVKWGAPHSLRYIGVGCGALFEKEMEMSETEFRAVKAERAKDELATALFICAAVAGYSIGGWEGFLVFLLFAAVAGNA